MKVFRDTPSAPSQLFLLPPCVDEFVPENAPVRVLCEVVDATDCTALLSRYRGGGAPAYDPRMLLKVLLLAYSDGLRSSRRIARALECDLRFLWLSGMSRPDFRTLCRFRTENQAAISTLFVEVVHLCQSLGLVLMRHVSVDGTKIEADVSGKQTYGEKRLDKEIAALEERITQILAEAEAADTEEDAQHGDDRGDEIPEDLTKAKARPERLQEAKQALRESGRKAICLTDEAARVMKTRSGNRPCYNGQAVVDAESQIIVAATVVADASDNAQLAPMVEAAKATTGVVPGIVTADGGYHSPASLAYGYETGLTAYIPESGETKAQEKARTDRVYDRQTDTYQDGAGRVYRFHTQREKDHKTYRIYRSERTPEGTYPEIWIRGDLALVEAMREKLQSEEGQSVYSLRKQIVEPVFGHIKTRLGLRRLLLRGELGHRSSTCSPVSPTM